MTIWATRNDNREQNGIPVGGAVFLHLTDFGVRGWANVLEILPSPVPEDLVTGCKKGSGGSKRGQVSLNAIKET